MNDIYVKSKILLIITNMVKEDKEDGTFHYRLTDKRYETVKGRTLKQILKETQRETYMVSEEPLKIKPGVFYIRKDGERAWVYNLV